MKTKEGSRAPIGSARSARRRDRCAVARDRRAAYAAFRRRPPCRIGAAKDLCTRTNHRGEPVTLLEGPALVTGAGAAAVITPGLPCATPGRRPARRRRERGCSAPTTTCTAAPSSKGFKGHLGALARGEVTSGAVKILGIGATGLAAAALAARAEAAVARALGMLADGALIAGSANLANLFDLRPGRAIKVGPARRGPAARAPRWRAAGRTAAALAAIPLGAAAALLPEDLGERAMLGDAGANALGALLGLAAVDPARPVRPARHRSARSPR